MNTQLLRTVREMILAEPLRLNMDFFLDHASIHSQLSAPSCGTMGCIAGWTLVAVYGFPTDIGDVLRFKDKTLTWFAVWDQATELLDISEGEATVLFSPMSAYKTGTPEYVQEVIDRIDNLIARHNEIPNTDLPSVYAS